MFDGGASETFDAVGCLIGFVTFIAAVIASSWFKGFLKMIPVLIGIVVGYLVAVPFGYVDFTPVLEAAWIGLPSITLPTLERERPAGHRPHRAWCCVVEHIGHLMTVTNLVRRGLQPVPLLFAAGQRPRHGGLRRSWAARP